MAAHSAAAADLKAPEGTASKFMAVFTALEGVQSIRTKALDEFYEKSEPHFLWLEEIVEEVRGKLNEVQEHQEESEDEDTEIQATLLPKTPSQKHRLRRKLKENESPLRESPAAPSPVRTAMKVKHASKRQSGLLSPAVARTKDEARGKPSPLSKVVFSPAAVPARPRDNIANSTVPSVSAATAPSAAAIVITTPPATASVRTVAAPAPSTRPAVAAVAPLPTPSLATIAPAPTGLRSPPKVRPILDIAPIVPVAVTLANTPPFLPSTLAPAAPVTTSPTGPLPTITAAATKQEAGPDRSRVTPLKAAWEAAVHAAHTKATPVAKPAIAGTSVKKMATLFENSPAPIASFAAPVPRFRAADLAKRAQEAINEAAEMDETSLVPASAPAPAAGGAAAAAPAPTTTTSSDAKVVAETSLDAAVTPAPPGPAGNAAAFSETQIAAGKKLVKEEMREEGSVGLQTYLSYINAAGGAVPVTVVALFYLLSVLAKIFSDYWLSWWLRQGNGTTSSGSIHDNPNRDTYALIYGLSAVAMLLVQFCRGLLHNRIVLRASSTLHNRLFYKVICAPMSYFDTTLTGRIVNRFSKDLDDVDVQLPMQLEQLLQNLLALLCSLALIAWIFPHFLIACGPIFCFYAWVVVNFKPTQREIKRCENLSRSPVISWLSASLQGLPTLHAYRKEHTFAVEYSSRVDANARAFFSLQYVTEWFALRLDLVTTLMTGTTALLVVILRGNVDNTLAALALLYATSLAGVLQFTTRLLADVETRFTSVERISTYVNTLPAEAPALVADKRPPPAWPTEGAITFKQVSARYQPSMPLVLKDMSCTIRPRDKIGIVGRTGAGKSSLALVLFRIVEPESGTVLIDGLDTAQMGLRDLRSKLAIIPQDPVLFAGTVRYNVDPFGTHDDTAIWAALERAHIKDKIAGLPQGLEASVVESGENFSVGERQLICMARALLRHSKILVMDEATAAIDTQTDGLIQRTIREAFSECTLLIIAHRLDTIADCDRIIVMDQGTIAEMDSPANLLANPTSHYARLVESATKAARELALTSN
eukprot:m.103383 g.103383  ORF g.103383 m.103383 type:complete len:1048 (+) comp14147_c6_seq1:59-3202(+)